MRFAIVDACIHLCDPAIARHEAEPVEFNNLEEGQATGMKGVFFRPDHLVALRARSAVVIAHGSSSMYEAVSNLFRGIQFWGEHFVLQGFVALVVNSFNPRVHCKIFT